MESIDSSANSSEPPPQRLADLLGTVIALVTLTLPMFAIARYSSHSMEVLPQVTYPIRPARE